MDRREVLKSFAAISVGAYVGGSDASGAPCDTEHKNITRFGAECPSGNYSRSVARRPRRRFYDRFATMRGVSQSTGDVLLYKHLAKDLGGRIVPHYQGSAPDGAPGEGDCVGQAGGLACDTLASVNRHMLGKNELWVAKASVEMNYAGSRVEIGGGAIRGRGGSHGEWMARWLKEYGVLHRIKYERDGNSIDLSGYHPGRSRKYRDIGVPDWLEPIAREHPVQEFTQVTSGREALDAVAAGQPVLMCSSYAFSNTRDSQGFADMLTGMVRTRGQNRWGRWFWFWARPQWWHCMLLWAKVNFDGREGGTIANSHGVWNGGPQPNDMPDGNFNVDIADLDVMVKDWLDCYALSSYKGHEAEGVKRRIHKLY